MGPSEAATPGAYLREINRSQSSRRISPSFSSGMVGGLASSHRQVFAVLSPEVST